MASPPEDRPVYQPDEVLAQLEQAQEERRDAPERTRATLLEALQRQRGLVESMQGSLETLEAQDACLAGYLAANFQAGLARACVGLMDVKGRQVAQRACIAACDACMRVDIAAGARTPPYRTRPAQLTHAGPVSTEWEHPLQPAGAEHDQARQGESE